MTTHTTELSTLELAVRLCGSQAELARRTESSSQEVWNWINRERKAPIEACPFIVAACRHPDVTLERLRPDYKGWDLLPACGFVPMRPSSELNPSPST